MSLAMPAPKNTKPASRRLCSAFGLYSLRSCFVRAPTRSYLALPAPKNTKPASRRLCSAFGLYSLRSCFVRAPTRSYLALPAPKNTKPASRRVSLWLRGKDLNLRPSGYEPDELPTAPPRVKKTNSYISCLLLLTSEAIITLFYMYVNRFCSEKPKKSVVFCKFNL